MPKEKDFADILLKLGIQPQLKGYHYALTALKLISQEPAIVYGQITTKLYPMVAEIHNSSSQRIERAIRHCVEYGYLHNKLVWEQYKFYQKPTVGAFLATMNEVVRLKLVS